ncbi:MAG: hypothetical protein A2Y14_00945 [Verrucomicrobia bacterium GWF2_51_19]|nr:MAG: hypothetical protein A2Y14_00945 [Verrucomicrobia bacterium GWF2_51_19]HCJ12192.1 3-dehydroquinate dehydratase [Opitutae bacterium]
MEELFNLSRHFLKNKNKPYKRYFLQQNPFAHPLSLLLGARGVGKTTVIIQYMLSHYGPLSTKILYLPTDHFLLKGQSLYAIAEKFYNNGGELLCFDETHKYRNWAQEIKSITDTFTRLKVIASGSSSLEINEGSYDLSRRAIAYRLYGLSFREYIELYHKIDLPVCSFEVIMRDHEAAADSVIRALDAVQLKILPLFKTYLRQGYYPYFNEYENEALFFISLEQSMHATLESDLMAVYPHLNGASLQKIKQLLAVLSELVPYKPDFKHLKAAVDVGDERTLKTYLRFLENGDLIRSIRRSRGFNQLEKPEKIYLNNTNQMYALKGSACNIGTVRETFFANALSCLYEVTYSDVGDFEVNHCIMELGGAKKNYNQIKDRPNSFLVIDDKEIGFGNKIPLWLFGFLY